MKITIGTILIALAIVGWRLHDMGPSAAGPSIFSNEAAPVDSPEWVSFEAALKAGDSTGRPSMIFIYADWCQWCQKTFRETFTDETILEYLGENYQVVKLNSDGSSAAIVVNEQNISEAQLSQILGATALPTFVFLDSEGQPITKTTGFYEAEILLELLKNVSAG